LDLQHTVVVEGSVPDLLTPASLDLFARGRDQILLARKQCRTVILPIEFSGA
jgi:hypothetical protein